MGDNDGNECPIQCPMDCGKDMMNCPGGDANGCIMPDTCMPTKGGPLDNNGLECPVLCPMNCGKDMMSCPGGDDGNGCMMPDTCMPTKGGPLMLSAWGQQQHPPTCMSVCNIDMDMGSDREK